MNEEKQKYLVLNTTASWLEGFSESVCITPEGDVTLWPGHTDVPLDGISRAGGFCFDKHNNLFVSDVERCRIYKFVRGKDGYKPDGYMGECGGMPGQFKFSPSGPGNGPQPCGRLATGQTALYVADTYNDRVQAFYLHNYQIRFIIGGQDKSGCRFVHSDETKLKQPSDVLADSKENTYVLDYGNKRVLKFNRHGRYENTIGTGVVTGPVSIALDKDDCVYVLDLVRKLGEVKKTAFKFGPDGSLITFDLMLNKACYSFEASCIAVDSNKLIYVGESVKGENKGNVHIFTEEGQYVGSFGEFSDTCRQLMFDKKDRLYGQFEQDGKVSKITLLKDNEKYATSGTYYSKHLDSTKADTVWHNFVLDADVPDKTKLEVSYYVSSSTINPQHILNNDWTNGLRSTVDREYARDALIQNGGGRYLYLKIELFGNGKLTPAVRQVKANFPRTSYLRYLPATYSTDDTGREFLERYLSLFETMADGLEHEITNMAGYFDPDAVNEEFLDWLGSWFAISKDENWPLEKRRILVKRAYGLYKMRGTLRGLEEIVSLYTGSKPFIIEHFRLMTPMVIGADMAVGFSTVVGRKVLPRLKLGSARIGECVITLAPLSPEGPFLSDAYDFTLHVNVSGLKSKCVKEMLKRIIEEEKPAHTRCFLRLAGTPERYMKLGVRSLIGIDTTIAKEYPAMRLGKEFGLGIDTLVGRIPSPKGTVGVRSKIGIDTIIN
ncbi:MAG: hypothetical protein GY797_07930 [Deltaproteobacteria bacterium]|nr:hypothetical protein [Deltaproteobacteria bacterium]MCP5007166.1 hypothetical protein [Planctomycetota bacterium]